LPLLLLLVHLLLLHEPRKLRKHVDVSILHCISTFSGGVSIGATGLLSKAFMLMDTSRRLREQSNSDKHG